MEASLELHYSVTDNYPPSDALDSSGMAYCGSQKLLEALMGQDLMGFHPDSRFMADGTDTDGIKLYFPTPTQQKINFEARHAINAKLKKSMCSQLKDIYGMEKLDILNGDSFVICDVYRHRYANRKKGGMPILYYRAHTDRSSHDLNDPDNPDNIYDYRDNHALLALGVPRDIKKVHPLYADPKLFYRLTHDRLLYSRETNKPLRADSFLLWSAGHDGLYGTQDDVTNFNR